MNTAYLISCKNSDCGRPIALPPPSHRGRFPNQLPWPEDGKPRNFLCQDCNHVYEYTVEDVQERPGVAPALDEEDRPDTVFQIEARCGEGNCSAPIFILLVGPSNQSTVGVAPDWLENKKHGTARCSAGHLTGVIQPGSVDVHPLSAWTK
jgi:hypothetical protein